jgi:hypothetical protein
MTFQTSEEYRRTWDALRRHGMLLLQDPKLPSVAALVAGRPVRGSWWSHPRSQLIYQVSEQLVGHPEVVVAKLVSGKVTYVHRLLWPALLAVARAREPWQLHGLPPACQALLRVLARDGEADPATIARSGLRTPKETVAELERRLLVHAEEVHTESGAHAKRVETWEHWLSRVAWSGPIPEPRIGRERLLEAVRQMCRESGGTCRLPWEAAGARS